tara:strand:- start:65 stop:1333 length:1269 start_codon:yes stop_codon:yes gene_type:complete
MLKSYDNSSTHNGKISIINEDNLGQINKNSKYSLVGSGNSISGFYICNNDNINLIRFKKNKIELNIENKTVIVGSSITFQELNNFLLDKKYIFYPSPSYPYCSIGAGVALNVHGVNPKLHGTIKENISCIKFFNPDLGIRQTYPGEDFFNLITGGFGMFGLVIEVELKITKLKYNYVEVKKQKAVDLIDGYNILNSNNYVSANNIFNLSTIGGKYEGIVLLSKKHVNFDKKKFSKIQDEKKYNYHLPILSNSYINKALQKINFYNELYNFTKFKKIKDVLFRSHNKTYYKNLFGKMSFFEHQVLISHSNVNDYFKELKKLLNKYNPIITLCHMKLFDGYRNFLEFDGSGLGFAYHVVNNQNGKKFINKVYNLDNELNCFPNISKNSNINMGILKLNHNNILTKYQKTHNKYSSFYFYNRVFA